ncbi:hypothetical protein A2892_03845 [Candidatus Woesebacteria bacterium RIFCSPLOWO2_01_FULL_39_10b]|uniref:Uncharacterized protein n=1 Tax=Candidatus Woesebacteria bacterium RIFCSPLOWO2_01_FULL_39_10b TaxID=1802517 RepID=A0A1F8B7H8_9BACT|nr:MAG: hypothetical protein A2892_03845 [Candidatus Woesebacteria bacterium RIFCSPLOWO2_01_FULL_39_10b]
MAVLIMPFFILFIFLFISVTPIYAHCPLCVAGAGVGLTFSRLLGINDSITGVWIGAFIGALAFWFQRILGAKNKLFFKPSTGVFLYTLFLLATIWSFYKFDLVARHGEIFGFHKLTFGMVVGSIVYCLVDLLNTYIKRKSGKSFFPYQSIVFSLSSIVLTSVGIYILINYYI